MILPVSQIAFLYTVGFLFITGLLVFESGLLEPKSCWELQKGRKILLCQTVSYK